MKVWNIIFLRFTGVLVFLIGIMNTHRDGYIYLTKVMIGLALFFLSFEKLDRMSKK